MTTENPIQANDASATRICYINGEFVPASEAKISIFDRGFLFSDSVYEVNLILDGQIVDNQGHMARLMRSLSEIGITLPMSQAELTQAQQSVIEKNAMQQGALYLQITRGQDSDRDFLPSADIKPNIVIIPQPKDFLNNPLADKGIKVMTVPEIRWANRHIKSTGLLGAVMAKQTAIANGYDDAWFIESGYVNEGSSNNAFIIKDNELITKPANQQILNGITRQAIMTMATQCNLSIVARDFSVEEAQQADEAFITSATMLVLPVIQIDDIVIGDGTPGPLAKQLRAIYIDTAKNHLLP